MLVAKARPRAPARISFRLLVLGMLLYTLEAYTIGPVPLSWLSSIALILSAGLILSGSRVFIPIMPVALLAFYLGVGVFSILWYNAWNSVPEMPFLATSSYPIFVALRVVNILAFISALISAYALVRSGLLDEFMAAHRKLLVFVTIAALYIYIAQITGGWEPPRNRTGTGGQDFISEGVSFSYLFHRATGTFREPSHMAEFLSAACLLAFADRGSSRFFRFQWVFFIAVILCLIHSGSVLGLIAFSAGLPVFLFSRRKRLLLVPAALLIVLPPALIAANAMFGVDFLAAVVPRIEALISAGVSGTNRSSIYEAAQTLQLRAIGYGFGNVSLLMSQITASDLVTPVLNLFLAILLDTGPVGLLAVTIVFLAPFAYFFRSGPHDPVFLGALAAHVSWIIAGIGRIPELTSMHGVVLGLLFGLMFASRRGRHA